MKPLKRIAVTACALFLTFSLAAQEKSAEEEYLSSVEDVVITELSNSDEKDNKLIALQYLENAAAEGRISPDMMVALDHLAGEGVNTQSRQGGRLVNNFPDVRARACDILAKVPTEQSKTTLKNIALQDNEPMVITAAVRSLGEIGLNDNDDVVNTIGWAVRKNQILNPTSSLALEVLIAYEKIADKVQNKSDMIQTVGSIASNYNYVTPVRKRALALLSKLQASNNKNKNKDAK